MERLGELINLGSSSEGNAFYVELKRDGYDKPFGLLLDCGFPYNTIASKLREYGKSLNDIDAVLVTHKHNDHSIGVKEMVSGGKKVYAPLSVFQMLGLEAIPRFTIESFTLKGIADGITVLPIPLDHQEQDGSYVENYGYIIEVNKDFRMMYITDTKFIKYNLRPYPSDLIIIEANFNIVTMKIVVEQNKGFQDKHFERVLNSHMSVQHTALWLSNLDLTRTKLIALMHLSSNTKVANTFKFRQIVEDKLRKVGKQHIPKIIVAKMNGGFQ